MRHQPPRLACVLYSIVLRPGDEAELGDLVEEYAEAAVPDLGVGPARRWFWGQVLRSIVPSLFTPIVRSGARDVGVGLCVGTVAFFGIGLAVAVFVSAFPSVSYPMRFTTYLLLSGGGAYAAGRLGAVYSRESSMLMGAALIVIVLMPQAVGLLARTSSEPLLAHALWAIMIPLGIVVGSRTGASRLGVAKNP